MPKKISKNTRSWEIYESLFKAQSPEPDAFNEVTQRFEPVPRRFPDLTKGQAINLAMTLNRIQIQDYEEMGLSRSQITKSAKAKPMPGYEDCDQNDNITKCWMLEVSVSYRHRAKPGRADDAMSRILMQARQNPNDDSPMAKIARLAQGTQGVPNITSDHSSPPVKPPVSDDLFKNMFGLDDDKPSGS